MWIDLNNHKFVDQSINIWSAYEDVWGLKYPELVAEFKKLEHRHLAVSDILDHGNGLVPSLLVDHDMVEQRKLEYISKLKVHIQRRKDGEVTWPQRVQILCWWEEQLRRNRHWIFNDGEFEKLYILFGKKIPMKKLGNACAAMNLNLR